MADRDDRHEKELDDWFDEPDTSAALAGRSPRLGRSGEDQPPPAGVDDWSSAGGNAPAAEPPSIRASPRRGRAIWAAAAIILVLCLLGGLALGGVFSGSHKASEATTTTTPAAPATTTAPRVTRTAPTVSAPSETLKPGDQGAAVKVLQGALAHLGYAAGATDGQYGPSTTQAVMRFQAAHGLTADGVLGPNTLRALTRALNSG